MHYSLNSFYYFFRYQWFFIAKNCVSLHAVIIKGLKQLSYIIVLSVVSLLFAACSGGSYPRQLLVADSLTYTNADSAVTMLKAMNMADAPERDRMYYSLLCLKANSKAYIPIKSDSGVSQMVDYYEHGGDKSLLPEAYFYAGIVYSNLNDAPQALEYFRKGIDALPEDADFNLKSNLYNQRGRLFMYQHLYDEAINMYKQSYKSDAMIKDTMKMVYSLRDIGNAYDAGNIKDSSLYYYKKAYLMSIQIRNKILGYEILSQMAEYYADNKEYVKAEQCLKREILNVNEGLKSPFYSIAIDIYMGTHRYDSAYYYCKELINIGTVYTKQKACNYLANICFMNGKAKDAEKYQNLYKIFTDSINSITSKRSVVMANSLYDYKLRETENTNLKINASRNWMLFCIIAMVCCIIISILLIYSTRNKQKNIELHRNLTMLELMKQEQLERKEKTIRQNNDKITQLEDILDKFKNEKEELLHTIETQKQKLIEANEKVRNEAEMENTVKMKIVRSEAYSIIRKKIDAKRPLTITELNTIDTVLGELMNDFKVHLYNTCNPSKQEYRICLLTKLNISITDIGILLCRSTSAISLAKKRLNTKIYGESEKGDAKTSKLDELIKSL